MNKVIKVISWPARKVYGYVASINTALEAPTQIKEATNKGFTYVTKLSAATTGSAGAAKGTVDALEALACQDGVCFIVSCIGVGADTLQVFASFVPGPNITALVTTPISLGCKVFVWCCKRSKLPWKNNC
jgi:hypothetical protein